MFYLQEMCCLCLKTPASLTDLFSSDRNGLAQFDKIAYSLTRIVNVIEDVEDLLLCNRCVDIIDMIYRFNNICLRNIEIFYSYKSILKQNVDKTKCNLNIKLNRDLEEIVSEIKPVKEKFLDFYLDESASGSDYIALADLDDLAAFEEEDDLFSENETKSKTEEPEQGENELLQSEESYNQKQSLAIEKQISKNKIHACHCCNKIFSAKYYLLRHLRKHTGERPFSCHICRTTFARKGGLDTHMRIHTGEKPFRCDVCNKCFNRKSLLVLHKSIHSGEKPFECDVCKKCFSRKTLLLQHKPIHSNEKPFSCDVCKKCFRQKSYLTKHKRIHSGNKPFACDVCERSFIQKMALVQHKLIHSAEKPFACVVCKTRFRHKISLKRHNLIHSGETPFACDVCKRCFRHKESLKKHRLTHRGKKHAKQSLKTTHPDFGGTVPGLVVYSKCPAI